MMIVSKNQTERLMNIGKHTIFHDDDDQQSPIIVG
jgi:hypothetical protein